MADGTSGPNIGATCEVNGTGLDLSTFGFDVAYKSAIEASAGLLANPHYSTHLQNGTTLSAQLDATAPATLTVAAIALDTTPGHELVIGTNNQSTFSRFGGAIGEIIVYNYAVANGSAQDTAIKSFLKTQWGLP
jgi:hypothetical protein